MFVRSCRSTPACAGFIVSGATFLVALVAPGNAMTPHQRKPVSLESTQRTEYRITQGGKEMGREAVEKKVFDDNRVVLTIDASLAYGPGVVMKQHVELTLEEESYFPRELHIVKTVSQPQQGTFEHHIDVRCSPTWR